MPSALQLSRDILARSVARVRSGLEGYERGLNTAGPEIAVEPFDAQNVSTPAALIKLGTAIAAGRRRRANFEEAREGLSLEREKTRAEIARLRAEGRQTEKSTPAGSEVITQGKYKGWAVRDANADIADRRLESSDLAHRAAGARAGRVAAARAGLAETEDEVVRRTNDAVTRKMAFYEQELFRGLDSPDRRVRDDAAQQVGIDPDQWEEYRRDDTIDRAAIVARARAGLRDRTLARSRAEIESFYRPRRAGYQAIIDEAATGTIDEDPLGISSEADPLGIGG